MSYPAMPSRSRTWVIGRISWETQGMLHYKHKQRQSSSYSSLRFSIISNEIAANALSMERLEKFSGKRTQKTENFVYYIQSIYTTTGYTSGWSESSTFNGFK
jgi:hypothetical protein